LAALAEAVLKSVHQPSNSYRFGARAAPVQNFIFFDIPIAVICKLGPQHPVTH
jgi:hypothetical protein